jgi:nicotinamidase-related amidase
MSHVALVVIDMQAAYFRNEALAREQDVLVKRANELIRAATEQGTSIYNVVTEHARDRSTWTLNMLDDGQGYLLAGGDDTKPVPGLNLETAHTVVKTRDSAFFETNLAELLHSNQVEKLVLLGVSTHGCVLQTAADAYAHNFRVVLARDAIATHDPTYHHAVLELLQQEYRQKCLSNAGIIKFMKQTRV